MVGSEHAPLHFTRSLEQQLSFGVLALAEQGNGQIARSGKCTWMLCSKHALLYGEHLALDLLRLGILPLAPSSNSLPT